MHLHIKKRLVKKHPLFYVPLLVLLLISSVGINIYASQKSPPIPSQGTISYRSVTFIIRYVWIGAMKTANDVDQYVAEHPWGNAIMLTDGSEGILNIVSYTGYDPSKAFGLDNWGRVGITHAQLKEVIDRFHYHGWKVIYSAANTPTKTGTPWIWHYINDTHRELAFTSGNGKKVGLEGADGDPSKKLIPNLFGIYSTADIERNISVGERLIDVYTDRLRKMIQDRAFEWDGWFGVDGWIGFPGGWSGQLWWLASTDDPWGKWIGTGSNSSWVDASYQAIDEWGNSMYVPAGFPPVGWESLSNTQRAWWIQHNANLEWWEYWMDCFARMYAQIRQVFVDTRPEEWYVGTILSVDTSSTWADNGINNPAGMINFTAFAKYNSADHYYVDCEWADELQGRRQAYVAGLIKSKNPEAHCIIGSGLVLPKYNYPLWKRKQEILAQMQTYVWNNGTRYRAVDPTWILFWCPTNTSWSDENAHGQELADWAKAMISLMAWNIEPVWLGPVDILPIYHRGNGLGYPSVNFTFAQFADVLNIRDHPEYITPEWETVFLDAVGSPGIGQASDCYDKILNLFSLNQLNVLYHGYGWDANFAKTIFGEGEAECESAFNLTDQGVGTTTSVFVLNEDQVTDPYARWIASGYFGDSYNLDEVGALNAGSGFVPIISYEDGFIELGLFYNTTSGRFFYGRSWSSLSWTPEVRIPRAIINRGIYWVSECPINSSEPLLDLKIFKLDDGTIFITTMNLKNFGLDIPSTMKIDAVELGLSDPSNYFVYWQSNREEISVSDWNNFSVTLSGGADILTIEPKGT